MECCELGGGEEGLVRFGQEPVDLVILGLNDDGVQSALIAGQIKRIWPEVPFIIHHYFVTDRDALMPNATQQADVVVLRSEEDRSLPDALKTALKS